MKAPVRALFELQVHPADIRRKVRTFFVTRRDLNWLAAGATTWALFVLVGLILAPMIFGGLWQRRELKTLSAERTHLEARLDAMDKRFADLSTTSKDLGLRIDKMFLVYGLSSEGREGQGGYPLPLGQRSISSLEAGLQERITAASTIERDLQERVGVTGIFLDEIEAFENARRELVDTTPSISPLRRSDFVLTSPFGYRRNPFTQRQAFHSGLDLAAARGTPIRAPADGKVLFAGLYPLRRSVGWWRYGNMVVMRHGEDFVSIFGHCDELLVKTGDVVRRGKTLATVGNTGMSTNNHLHYEIRRRGDSEVFRPVDPRIYILDQRWRGEEELLVRSRTAPAETDYQALPSFAVR